MAEFVHIAVKLVAYGAAVAGFGVLLLVAVGIKTHGFAALFAARKG